MRVEERPVQVVDVFHDVDEELCLGRLVPVREWTYCRECLMELCM